MCPRKDKILAKVDVRDKATIKERVTAYQNIGADALLKQAVDEFGISARAYTRILKVGRTIADVDGSEKLGVEHIAEAIQYRTPHSDVWE